MHIDQFTVYMSNLLLNFIDNYQKHQKDEGKNKWPDDLSLKDWLEQLQTFFAYKEMKDATLDNTKRKIL